MEESFSREILEYADENSVIIEPAALKILENREDYKEIIDALIAEKLFVITEQKVRDHIIRAETKIYETPKVIVNKTNFAALAKDIEPNFKIMEQYDITGHSYSEGKVADFLTYFRDKFNFLSNTLKTHPNFVPKEISALEKLATRAEFQTIGMVNKKWKTKNEHIALQIEDLDSECIVILSKDDQKISKAGAAVLLDDVIGIKGVKLSNEMIIAKEILVPDLPQRTPKKPDRDLNIITTSDMHVGSKLFMEKEFNKFTAWLNGAGLPDSDKEHVGKIKYIFITGDNVDGVGVYPEQYDELAIKDIFGQYSELTRLISQIPEYIQVFICPGQHDAVRRADPQPAIPKEYVRELSALGNVFFIGSPSWVEVEGLKCMIYHGASLHDLYSNVNFLSPKEPQKAMLELLKKRDLMSVYGSGNPYVPEQRDYMVIREEPDFYFGGDMHHNGYEMYRGCMIVNSGAWQARTEYQVKQGHFPTPGIVPEINLKTRHIRENVFYKGAQQ